LRPESEALGRLEAKAKAEFDVSRLSLAIKSRIVSESTKAAVVVQTKVVIGPLIVVQNVSEDALELQVDAFRHSDALLNAEVHIPVGQATQDSRAAIPGIYPENWVAPVLGLGHPVRKIIYRVPVGLT